jgi:hypothetical protein
MTLSDDFQTLAVGDVFYAEYASIEQDSGAAICLVVDHTPDVIVARTVTTQWLLSFDRKTLTAPGRAGPATFRVRSVKPLPADIRFVLVGLDARYRAGDNPRLSDAEKHALIFAAEHYGYADRTGQPSG